MAEVLGELNVGRFHLFAQGWGITVAQALARMGPDRVLSLRMSGDPSRDVAEGGRFLPDPLGAHLDAAWAQMASRLSGEASIDVIHRATIDRLKAGDGVAPGVPPRDAPATPPGRSDAGYPMLRDPTGFCADIVKTVAEGEKR